ncbi:MAG: cobalamin-dependent protein [Thermodesulfobacteriota bacterium]
MIGAAGSLRDRIACCLSQWRQSPANPSRSVLEATAREVLEWKKRNSTPGIWEKTPVLVTATLDDGWGHGIQLIQLFAEAAGMKVIPLGVLQEAEWVVSSCREIQPELLGLTVLQLDSEEQLTSICRRIPPDTTVVAGGPVFSADPALAARAGVAHVARNAADFWEFLLTCRFTKEFRAF